VIRDFDGPVALTTKIAAMIAAGAKIYVSVLYVLWHRAGRPDGPENEVMRVLGRILSRDSISRMPI
jgi:PST family polysaccharide transporter